MRRLALIALCLGVPAGAQESLDEIDKAATVDPKMGSKEGKAVAEVNGYLDNRFGVAWSHTGGVAPITDLPTLSELLEANIQLKVKIGQKLFAYGDVSLFFQGGWLFYDTGPNGERVRVPEHDVPALRPLVVPAELYLSYAPAPWLQLLVGKKRITWGAGFAFNPTDLINPPKDPTDPTFQRAGAWVARIEAPFRNFTLTALFSPTVLSSQSGIPSNILCYQDYPTAESGLPLAGYKAPNTEAHFLAAARIYALIYNSDVNLIYYFSNLARGDSDFRNKSRVGFSFSRYFFTDWEMHVEALFQLGTTRRYADPAVANGGVPAIQANQALIDLVLPQLNLESSTVYPRVIAGTRRIFADESSLSIEYYYQADGFSGWRFRDYVSLLTRGQQLGLSHLAMGQGGSQGGLPQKFSFDPLRRHYLIANYTKPRIFDDWLAGLTLILGLEDLSGLLSPTVGWTPKEWLSLSLSGFIPFHGSWLSEYSLSPQDWRVLFEVRAFY